MITSPSPSGFEQPVQQVIREEIQQYTDEIRTDIHGNVIATLHPGGNPRVMLTAHCDELGFLVRYIDESGFLYFAPIGGFDAATLPGNRITLHTPSGPVLGVIGRKPIHSLRGEERERLPRLSDLWIDIGASSRAEALSLVPPGTVATRAAELEVLRGDIVVSRALDDKSGVFSVVEAMRRIHLRATELQAEVVFVSSVQEEVGSRGAHTSTYGVDPLIAVAVDVTPTSDHPGTSKQDIGDIQLNGGPVITIGGRVNPRVFQLLVQAAEDSGLAWQIDLQSSYTYTDADNIQIARAGVATALVSIPCRYLHTASEIVSLKDVDEVAELLARFVLALNANTNVIP